MQFELNLVVELDPSANFIEAGEQGAKSGLVYAVVDILYELDDVKVLEIQAKEKE